MDDLIQSINTDIKFGADALDNQSHSKFIDDDFMTKIIELNKKKDT
eukprot:CAMPEP_0201585366 /NCGR_PEP_ID=MMETSP0190_2-20130828/121135_1 /ASSEMBLY_ACC=CAM_ASM_000263 /TAXON_ID=37353 /ORGANISM="Rosalina sp." /LENGTH=45 /DNA_ID= /DNA_START= /DNA_END= /DNA_ORIENTATION=